MVPSVKFDIAFGDYNDRSAHPEGLENRALLTFVTTSDRCTADAKARHVKSSTYGTKFELLCKDLQRSVPYSRHTSSCSADLELCLIPCKPMTTNDKRHVTWQAKAGGAGRLVAHQLHFMLG
jgi:hypothetical protein